MDGDVYMKAGAQIRATAKLTVAAPWPVSEFDQLMPNGGADLFLERGIAHGDGSREWVSLGYYRLDDVEQEDAPDGPIEIEASDRMAAIIDAQLLQPRQYRADSVIRSVVEDLVLEIYPDATVVLEGFDADGILGSDQICTRDRYKFLNDIARAHGCTMHFDYAGRFVMRPIPDYSQISPAWTINHGARGVLVKMSRRLSRSSMFNAVVADGEQAGSELPVQGIAYDLNSQSPTRWNGPFKQVPRFWQSSLLRTNDQAFEAAKAMLARSIGVPYTITFTAVPNAALEPLDLVKVTYGDQHPTEHHVVDTLTIPMIAPRAMTGTSRVQPKDVLDDE
jgi:hypothetical protein